MALCKERLQPNSNRYFLYPKDKNMRNIFADLYLQKRINKSTKSIKDDFHSPSH